MASDNPDEHTVIVPRPGGTRRSGAPGGNAAPPPPEASPQPAGGTGGDPLPSLERQYAEGLPDMGASPILGLASPLIGLAIRLRTSSLQGTVEALRDRVIIEMRRFEERLGALGLPAQVVRAAHYAVCATLDDVVLNTPWGGVSIWSHHSLASTLHHEAVGGERFFILLDNLKRNPAGNLHLLELMYVCLSIGFTGRFRLRPQGANELAQLHNDLYQEICNQRPRRERDLSPRWAGLGQAHQPVHSMVPPWVSLAAGVVLALLVYIALMFKLNATSDEAYERLGKLPPSKPAAITVVLPPTARPSRLQNFLADEVREHLVTVQETASEITVSILAQGMFASGSAEVEARLNDILRRLGQALRDEPGDILVAGHTDNIPIRSMRFPSNWHLSLARAQAAQTILAATAGSGRHIDAKGFADSQPVTSNDTPAGRASNRRIEVILHKPLPVSAAAAISRESAP